MNEGIPGPDDVAYQIALYAGVPLGVVMFFAVCWTLLAWFRFLITALLGLSVARDQAASFYRTLPTEVVEGCAMLTAYVLSGVYLGQCMQKVEHGGDYDAPWKFALIRYEYTLEVALVLVGIALVSLVDIVFGMRLAYVPFMALAGLSIAALGVCGLAGLAAAIVALVGLLALATGNAFGGWPVVLTFGSIAISFPMWYWSSIYVYGAFIARDRARS